MTTEKEGTVWSRLTHNSRFYILLFSGWFSGSVLLLVLLFIASPTLQVIRLEQIYAFTSLTFLYLAMLITPLLALFPDLQKNRREMIIHTRRGIGVSACYFALLHAGIAFFGQLGGFSGIRFLPANYQGPLLLGLGGLIILFLMAITSTDWAIEFLSFPRWKRLHRLVYIGGFIVILHVYFIGTHLNTGRTPLTLIIGLLTMLLIALEALRLLQKGTQAKAEKRRVWWLYYAGVIVGLVLGIFLFAPLLFNTASAHELETDSSIGAILHINPGDNPVAGKPAELYFSVKDTAGNFDANQCACKVIVLADRDGTLLDSHAVTPDNIEGRGIILTDFTFPSQGIYDVILTGEPMNGGTFEAFHLHYLQRVDQGIALDEPVIKNKSPFLVLTAFVFINSYPIGMAWLLHQRLTSN